MRLPHGLVLATMLALPALAGCLGASTEGAPLDDAATPAYPNGHRAGPGAGDDPTLSTARWGEPDDATVRPGVQVVSRVGQCTSNFVFTSPDERLVYLGLAAHCVEGMAQGDPLDIGPGVATGTLAYSSWNTMDENGETDQAALDYNDFALVLIDDADRDKVHPAMRHFGGPVALADTSTVDTGDRVLTYGNSGLRQQIDPLSWHEGIVVDRPDPWTTNVYTVTPGIPGDSGSGALTGDGQALGVVVTLTVAPTAGSNGITSLDLALDYAREHAGIDARLATWELLDPGLLGAVSESPGGLDGDALPALDLPETGLLPGL